MVVWSTLSNTRALTRCVSHVDGLGIELKFVHRKQGCRRRLASRLARRVMKKLRREICLSMQKLQLRNRLSGRGFWFHENGKLEKVTRKIKPIFLFFLDL